MVFDVCGVDLGLEVRVGTHEGAGAGRGVKQGRLAHGSLATHLRIRLGIMG